ncbi:DUF3987 domain-containing protein [Pontiellaceae bacterium B12227]|nr:DUF3987 domain-containing protein [Pontiellaceae bacterium B12227]
MSNNVIESKANRSKENDLSHPDQMNLFGGGAGTEKKTINTKATNGSPPGTTTSVEPEPALETKHMHSKNEVSEDGRQQGANASPKSSFIQTLAEDAMPSQADEDQEILPLFPLQSLPGFTAQLAEQAAAVAQMPPQLPAMLMLATASAAIGKSVVAIGGSNHGPCLGNLYMLAVAKSSTGKSVAAKLTAPIFDFEEELLIQYEALENNSVAPRLTIQNSTSEALAHHMSTGCDETLYSFSPEAGDNLRIAAGAYRKAGGDFAFLNSAWSGDHCEFTRMTRDAVRLREPCLTLFWAIQPFFFNELAANKEAAMGGFTARCLTFDAAAEWIHDDGGYREIDKKLIGQWHNTLHKIMERRILNPNADPVQIPCTPEARETFRTLHNESIDRRNSEIDIADLLGKMRENAIRLALVLAVLQDASQINGEIAENACRIVRWCIDSLLSMLSGARANTLEREVDRLTMKLEKAGGKETIRNLLRGGWERKKVEQLAKRFPLRFEIRTIKPPKGRPSEFIVIC